MPPASTPVYAVVNMQEACIAVITFGSWDNGMHLHTGYVCMNYEVCMVVGGGTCQKPCNYLSPALLILSLSFLYGEGLLVASHHRSTSSRTAGVTCLHRL